MLQERTRARLALVLVSGKGVQAVRLRGLSRMLLLLLEMLPMPCWP